MSRRRRAERMHTGPGSREVGIWYGTARRRVVWACACALLSGTDYVRKKGISPFLSSFPPLLSCRWPPKTHVTRASPNSAGPATAAGPLALVRAAFQSDIARHRLPCHHNGLTAFLWPELEQEGRLARSKRTIEG